MKRSMDGLDERIIRLLGEDGRLSVGTLAARLEVTTPTVRTRLKNLREAGLLKIAGMIDPSRHPEFTTAIIGLQVRAYGKLDEILDRLVEIDRVTWAVAVTGRYDVMLEVLFDGGTEDLFEITSRLIPEVGLVDQSETFVVIKSRDKWVSLPPELERRAGTGGEAAPSEGTERTD